MLPDTVSIKIPAHGVVLLTMTPAPDTQSSSHQR